MANLTSHIAIAPVFLGLTALTSAAGAAIFGFDGINDVVEGLREGGEAFDGVIESGAVETALNGVDPAEAEEAKNLLRQHMTEHAKEVAIEIANNKDVALSELTPEDFATAMQDPKNALPPITGELAQAFDGDKSAILTAYNTSIADGTIDSTVFQATAKDTLLPMLQGTEDLKQGALYGAAIGGIGSTVAAPAITNKILGKWTANEVARDAQQGVRQVT